MACINDKAVKWVLKFMFSETKFSKFQLYYKITIFAQSIDLTEAKDRILKDHRTEKIN